MFSAPPNGMGQYMTFMIVYLGDRHSDTPEELRPCHVPTLEAAIRNAKSTVQNMALAKGRFRKLVVGFIIENQDGDEVYRWYDDVLCTTPTTSNG